MIGCPSHRALLGLMVFRPGTGGRQPGGVEMDREKVFCCDQFFISVSDPVSREEDIYSGSEHPPHSAVLLQAVSLHTQTTIKLTQR